MGQDRCDKINRRADSRRVEGNKEIGRQIKNEIETHSSQVEGETGYRWGVSSLDMGD